MKQITDKILIVDDEINTADAYKEIFENEGFPSIAAYSSDSALSIIQNDDSIFLILTDLRLGDSNGFDLIKKIQTLRTDVFFIIITAYGTVNNAVDALKRGINDYFTKPVDFEKLKISVNGIYEKFLLQKENSFLKSKIANLYSFGNIIGRSEKMREIFSLANKVSKTNATVLLRGETGTGKGLLASSIHYNSPRKDKPFIEINCAAIPENLLESELFGHKKGSFTGAISNRKGKFLEAGDGTVFLDEIGEINWNIQTKLLRILQDKTFEEVGSNLPVKMEARIIAATNCNLEEAIKEKKFREDLYYRLNVVPIYIPPLRDRKEDIPDLLYFFLKKYCSENKVPQKKFQPDAIDILTMYSWPGNVRELENLVERLVIIIDSETISDKDILALKRNLQNEIQPINVGNLEELISCYEKKIIWKTLVVCGSNRTKAAKTLNISLRQLQYKIKKYGL